MMNIELLDYIAKLEEEVKFLRQRNKELRQKSWYPVFEENINLTKENNHLKEVLKSVETFIGQYSIR